ncbi:LPS export ABC transporter periplasmic protein LptC [Thiomicrolovo sp. ZZH C-3]
MSVTSFYLLIGAVLGSIFFFFKPLQVDIASPGELAQIELERFTVYEVEATGVKTILAGAHASRFPNRYELVDLNLTDRSEGHVQTMQARKGVYKEPLISLEGEVHFRRDDGTTFETAKADYNQSSGDVRAPGAFILRQAQDRVDGQNLYYNIKRGDITAKKIVGIYTMKEKM